MWTERLGQVKCGPEFGGHNLSLKEFTAEDLVQNLVPLGREICRVILGLGFGHHKVPTVDDDEVEEVYTTSQLTAVTNNAAFVLRGCPPNRILEWPTCEFRDEEVDDQGKSRRPIIQGDRGSHLSTRTSRAPGGGKRKRPKRAEPWYDASCPPVFSSYMLAMPDNLKGVLVFKKVPYLKLEIKPKTWRWRHYCHLTAVPFVGQPGLRREWKYGTRCFR